MAFKVHNLHFKSPDPRKTAQWYIDNLGAKLTREVERAGGDIGYRLDLDGVPLNITGFSQGQELGQFHGLEHIGMFADADDLPGVIERIKASGSPILEELYTSGGQKCYFIEGPDGVRIEIMEPIP